MFYYNIQDDNHQGGVIRDIQMTEKEDGTLKIYPSKLCNIKDMLMLKLTTI